MKRVLIADDEYLVRLGLQTTIDWEGHGFRIVGEAADGVEAIRLFELTDPDILLTDIKMPGMDGLELIAELKKRKPSLYVVILTHYNDFSYAQKAILLGASQYILKSELNQASVLSTLERLLTSMEEVGQAEPNAEGHLRDFLRRCILMDGQGVYPEPSGVLLSQGSYVMASCRCDTSVLAPEGQEMFHRSVRTMIDKVWPQPFAVSTQIGDRLRVFLLLRLENGMQQEELVQNLQRLSLNLRQYFDALFQVGVSGIMNEGDLCRMIVQAEDALNGCFFSDEAISIFKPAPISYPASPAVDPAKVNTPIQNRDWKLLKTYIHEAFVALRLQGDIRRVQNAYIDFISLARQHASRYNALGNDFIVEKQLNYDRVSSFCHIDTMEMVITDIYRTMLMTLEGTERRYSGVINRCIRYIHANYQNNIALSDAAQEANVSKSYLSLLFKQETGINFSKYLMDYRIEEAKELLSNTTLKIYEVADQVGFPNPYYFSKVFKDLTGLSCKDYKNLHT